MTVKLLLSGDVAGSLSGLSKRVAAVNKTNGPFDVCFCAGGFFPSAGLLHLKYCNMLSASHAAPQVCLRQQSDTWICFPAAVPGTNLMPMQFSIASHDASHAYEQGKQMMRK